MEASQEVAREFVDEEMVREILRAVRTIKHGSVQLIIQDGRVIQIDRTEKLRLSRKGSS